MKRKVLMNPRAYSEGAEHVSRNIVDILVRLERMEERMESRDSTVDEIKLTVDKFLDKFGVLETAMHKEVDANYVKKVEFEPVKRFVYGVIVMVLASVGSWVIGLATKTLPASLVPVSVISTGASAPLARSTPTEEAKTVLSPEKPPAPEK